jgi:hypothetical protein
MLAALWDELGIQQSHMAWALDGWNDPQSEDLGD